MPRFRLDEKRTQPRPDRRLGIKLEAPISKRVLGGKLDAYVPPELRYDYNPPSVFARYKILTAVFVALALGLLSAWVLALRRSPMPPTPPAAGAPAVAGSAAAGSAAARSAAAQNQPVYVEPLPTR